MNKAKAAITEFMGKSGHHDTTVHETVAPSVQHETVKPHKHENFTTAVDKEVHQDHYHRTVQPVKDREVLPEQHTANIGAVQHKEFDHRSHDETKRALATDQSGFKNETVVANTTHTQSAQPALAGEHVHHHIHETIQPVVHKETIQPNVVHTTVPIHEVHHNAAKHHETTALPEMTMSEFKSQGGVLGGREERFDGFAGEPKKVGGIMSGFTKSSKRDSADVDESLRKSAMHGDFDPLDGKSHGSMDSTAPGNIQKVEMSGRQSHSPSMQEPFAAHNAPATSTLHKSTTEARKPSLMEKLNPRIDADGDGKKGFMD
ncbi:hypothetical protein BS50DRAFT_542087 [Corynespora cassiicola Philippines]|uniref:Allergen n=1 Tax=Corynespora cassiicola Philippines TaxID=1448308 RepID=A0A2T2P5C3_CORCC|nr:hypothetical protein BS50DRAFT_542087 [Corynespora cassiicola Philippines]